MVTCKETRAAIIALHKKGLTGKDIAAKKVAPKSTIYRIIKNFKERGSILAKKASGRPRKSSKHQDSLLRLAQHRDWGSTSAELAQEWQQAGVTVSARTVRRRLLEDDLLSKREAKKLNLSKKNRKAGIKPCSVTISLSDCLNQPGKGLSGEEKASAPISSVSSSQLLLSQGTGVSDSLASEKS